MASKTSNQTNPGLYMELNAVSLLFLTLVTAVILLWSLKPSASSQKQKPPGPWRLPLIGNLLHLVTSEPHVALRNLASKHGPVMYLRLGQIDVVVVSSTAAVQEVLRDKDLTFASRPKLLVPEIVVYGCMDIGFAPYGAYWRTIRKLCITELLSASRVRQLAPVRDGETLSVIREIGATSRRGEPVNLRRLVLSCSTAIAGKATFGRLCDVGELMEVFDVTAKYSSGFCAGDVFPSLWFVDVVTGLKRRLRRARRQLDAIFDRIIAECEARRQGETTAKGHDDGLGFLGVLLRIRDEGGPETSISMTSIKAIIFDMLGGGTETTSSAVEWIMSELMRNPEAIAKAQAEVRGALDGKSPQDHEAQIGKLSYTRMAIKEGMRLYPVFPLLLPRLCREACDIGGFQVAKGTTVIVNAWALARSPDYWQDPDEFRPERFDVSTGSAADYVGSQFEYMPFGSGRRMCPGNIFALAVLELLVVRLLYYFDWSLPDGMRPDELNMDTVIGSAMRRRNDLRLVASRYKELPAGI